MAEENRSVEDQLREVISLLKTIENSLTYTATLLEPLTREILANKINDETMRNIKGRTVSRDSGYSCSMDSAVMNPISVTSGLFENLPAIPEITLARPEANDPLNTMTSSSLEDIHVFPTCIRSRPEGHLLVDLPSVQERRRSGSEHDDESHRKESEEENSI